MPMRSVQPVDPAVRIRALKQMLAAGERVPDQPSTPVPPASQHGYFDDPPPTDLMLEDVGPPQFPQKPLPVDEEMQRSGPSSGTWRRNDRTVPPAYRSRVESYYGRG